MENTTQESCAQQANTPWTLADLFDYEVLLAILERYGYFNEEPPRVH